MNEHRLLRFVGSGGQYIAAVLELALTDEAFRPLVVIAPAFEHTIQNSFVIARYFLAQGFDVLRYDACNHLGLSDGNIEDHTLQGAMTDMMDVVRFARANLSPGNISLVATSLAGRVALRAAGSLSDELTCVASIACVVDVRTTVASAAGIDVFGNWIDGTVSDPEHTCKVVKNHVKYAYCRNAIEYNWHTLESSLSDAMGASRVPFFNVHGEQDPWVSTQDVLTLAERSKNASIVVLRGAVHELNAATSRIGLCHLVRFVVSHAQERTIAFEDIPVLQWDALVAFNKRERSWEKTPLEQWSVQHAHKRKEMK